MDVPASSIVGHYEVDDTVLRDIMEQVLLPDVCQFTITRWDLG
jgi:hypothetical protein